MLRWKNGKEGSTQLLQATRHFLQIHIPQCANLHPRGCKPAEKFCEYICCANHMQHLNYKWHGKSLYCIVAYIWSNARSSKIQVPQITEVNTKEQHARDATLQQNLLPPSALNLTATISNSTGRQSQCIVLSLAYKYKSLIWHTQTPTCLLGSQLYKHASHQAFSRMMYICVVF